MHSLGAGAGSESSRDLSAAARQGRNDFGLSQYSGPSRRLKADKAKALDEFNNGTGGFKDRDLYVFCTQASDGKIVAVLANPNAKSLIGTDQRTLNDATGKEFGKELFAAAQKPEGQFTEITYMFPRPGADPKPVPKVSLVTRVDDLGCGVGYYK